jgi:hypothetical protein
MVGETEGPKREGKKRASGRRGLRGEVSREEAGDAKVRRCET